MELVVIVPIAGVAAILFAAYLAWDVLKRDTGTKEMQFIAGTIFEGAMAFLKAEYKILAIFVVIAGAALGVLSQMVATYVNKPALALP